MREGGGLALEQRKSEMEMESGPGRRDGPNHDALSRRPFSLGQLESVPGASEAGLGAHESLSCAFRVRGAGSNESAFYNGKLKERAQDGVGRSVGAHESPSCAFQRCAARREEIQFCMGS